jgi:uncharacterized membrane protein
MDGITATTRPAAATGDVRTRFRVDPAIALAVAAFALAFVLRIELISAPLSFDEFASLYFADRPFTDLWGWWMVRETNPALFYTLLKVWRMVVPDSVETLRALPIAISLAQIILLARFAHRTYGGLAAALAILLLALSPSDVFLTGDIRAYGLAKLAITVSFIGLVKALNEEDARIGGWLTYAGGAAIAIYTHTTMLLWPAVATLAVLAEAAISRDIPRGKLARLMIANLAVALLSVWELLLVIAQLRVHTANIAWIQPLSLEDFRDEITLQLLMQSTASSILMLGLMIFGIARTFRNRTTRLALFAAVAGMIAFKAADQLHPVISDYTLHWAASFTVLLAAAALAARRVSPSRIGARIYWIGGAAVLTLVTAIGLVDFEGDDWLPQPQDWGYTVRIVAQTPGAALLASHESVGLVVEQACKLEFHQSGCPFPLVVMANPSQADSWSFGGYSGRIMPVREVRTALGPARTVFAFSRYVYTPLESLGLDPGDYKEVEWDDGELIGPIPIEDFPEAHKAPAQISIR